MATQYHRIADTLRTQITSGVLAAGERLPSEKELAQKYGVGMPTLRRALDVLQAEGLVEKRHGLGNFVRRPPAVIRYTSGQRHQQQPGHELHIEARVSEVPAGSPLSALIDVPAGAQVTERVLFSRRDGIPYVLTRIYTPLPVEALRDLPALSPWGHDTRPVLAAAGFEITATVERVTARPPTFAETEELRIAPGSPVLNVERTSTDPHGKTVEAAFLILPGDRTEAVFATGHPEER